MHDNVVVKQRVNAPVEKVWSAITDTAQMKEWYFDIPDFKAEPHTEFAFWGGSEDQQFHHHGEVLEVIPHQKLKHTWTYPEISKEKTLVRWELESDGDGTVVTLTHKGIENFNHLGQDFQHSSFEEGWKDIVGRSLKEYVEK